MRKTFIAIAIACLLLPETMGEVRVDPDRVSYTLGINELETDLALITTTVMPGRELRIRTHASAGADRGELQPREDGWAWRAPETPGLARLTFEHNEEVRRLLVFVLTPFQNRQQDQLNGYRIGAYSAAPFRGLSTYRAPLGFIEVTPDMLDIKVSPNFTVRQFLCKQQPGHDPTYLLIRPAMLAKLEAVLDKVQAAGHDVETLTVMSGFRTPWYNASIGNRTTSSRHLYGGAADVFVDADGDGWMDDMNGDGKVDIADAKTLAAMAETIAGVSSKAEWPAGGIGIYRANAVHGPFVHIDARGYQARW